MEIADRLPLGPDRERWLEAATETDRLANSLSLNRPYDLLLDLRGAGDEAGQQIDVIGDVEELLQLELDGTAEQLPDDEAAAPADEPAPAPGEPASASPGDSDTPPGQPDTPPGQPDTRPGQPDAPDDAATTTATAATATPTSTTTSVPEGPPAYIRAVPVSAEAPLVSWVVGDSQAFFLGHGLREGRLRDVTEITLDQRHSTGLARSGYFNWPVHFFAIAAHYNAEVVVATLGSNDWQSMTAPEGHTLNRGSDEDEIEGIIARISPEVTAPAAPESQPEPEPG